MEAIIQKDAAAGKNETATVQDLVLRYGVKVLATPPPRGFNLTVWILPGLALIAGFVVLLAIVRRWSGGPAQVQKAPAGSIDPKVLAAVEEERKGTGMSD